MSCGVANMISVLVLNILDAHVPEDHIVLWDCAL